MLSASLNKTFPSCCPRCFRTDTVALCHAAVLAPVRLAGVVTATRGVRARDGQLRGRRAGGGHLHRPGRHAAGSQQSPVHVPGLWTRHVGKCFQGNLGRKEMFYFNDALNTFYLRLYGVGGHMVKDHSDSERGNLLPPHGLLFSINRKGSFICIIPQAG